MRRLSAGFVYKPAPLSQKARVRIDGSALEISRAADGGAARVFALSGLSGGRWRETGVRVGRSVMVERWLHLAGPAGSIVMRQGGGRPDGAYDPNTEAYLRAAAAVLAAAARENPGLMLAAGPGPALAWSMSCIGAAGAILGLLCAGAALGSLLSGLFLDAALFAALALALGAGGASWLVTHWPFRIIPMRSAADIAADIERRLGEAS